MKVPVYLQSNLELLGVVDIGQYEVDTLVARGVLRLEKMGPIGGAIGTKYTPISMPTVTRYTIQYFPIGNGSGARNICLLVDSKEAMSVFERRLWPRKRNQRRRRRVKWKPSIHHGLAAERIWGKKAALAIKDDVS